MEDTGEAHCIVLSQVLEIGRQDVFRASREVVGARPDFGGSLNKSRYIIVLVVCSACLFIPLYNLPPLFFPG